MTDRRTRLERAHLYLVCDARETPFLDAALRGGVDIVQLRMKDAPEEAIRAAASRFAPVCAAHGALFILNDRPDLAAAVGADGVHVGQDDMTVSEARQIVGDDALVGLSTHSPSQVDGAEGVDYIGVGPVHATPTKAGRPAVGLELVRYAAQRAPVPFFAIGGIDTGNVSAVRDAGAARIAVVRALGDADDVEAAAAALRAAVSEAPVAGRSRKRGRRERPAARAESPRAGSSPPAETSLQRGYRRGEERNEAIRASLTPLEADERPWPLRVAVVIALLIAVGNIVQVAFGSKVKFGSTHTSVPGVALFSLIMLVCAIGMWQRRYWAVLGFEALLAIVVLAFCFVLITAVDVLRVIIALLVIGGGGYLFFKLVRVLSRLQMPSARRGG